MQQQHRWRQQQKHSQPIHPHAFLDTCIDNHTIKLLSILGVGAYGIVYKAVHLRTGEFFAVKLVTHVNKQSEADIHALVSGHPNILSLIKRVDEGPVTFLVLEYCPQGDLFTTLTRKRQAQKPGEAEGESAAGIIGNNDLIRHIFLQLLDAVQHCHTLHVAHRDLKPENILIFPNNHVKLADFGLATTSAVSAEFGCGSSFYFSPECHGGLLRNQQRIKGYSTQQNDVWSLGIILINLATGRNPWKQAAQHDASFAAYCSRRHRPGFFRLLLPSISPALESILDGIFCLDPSRRMSLPELRVRVSQCAVFTYQPQQHHPYVTPPSSPRLLLPHSHGIMSPPKSPDAEACWNLQELSSVMDDIQAYASSFSSSSSASEEPITPIE
ncbi:kinase-like domain-containing protein [Dichotomocladium elegans]|nr:kinase-like domain-containing protein [Dichotomocladium elegans]